MAGNSDDPRAQLVEAISWQASGCRPLGCPFYEALCEEMARAVGHDGPAWSVLQPFAAASRDAAYVLRLLAGIHRLVLTGDAPNIAAHYPSAGGDGDAKAAMAAINELLEDPPGAIHEALARPPQTNEVGRSIALASGLLVIANETGLPLRLREIGSSGGLNLRLDSYWYEQGGRGWGDPTSPIRFVDLWRGGGPPFERGAVVAERVGCDQNPIDVTTPEGAVTLLSYVWPEPAERFIRLRDAIGLARGLPVRIDRADAASWLPDQLVPRIGTALVVLHSVVWQYLDGSTATALETAIGSAGAAASPSAPVAWLRLEPNPRTYAPAELTLSLWSGGAPSERLLATSGFHGGALTWCS